MTERLLSQQTNKKEKKRKINIKRRNKQKESDQKTKEKDEGICLRKGKLDCRAGNVREWKEWVDQEWFEREWLVFTVREQSWCLTKFWRRIELNSILSLEVSWSTDSRCLRLRMTEKWVGKRWTLSGCVALSLNWIASSSVWHLACHTDNTRADSWAVKTQQQVLWNL